MYHPSLRKLLKLVYLVPNGIMEMNGALDMKGLVESSINQGVMRAGDNFFVLVGEIRYSHISSRNFIIEKIWLCLSCWRLKLNCLPHILHGNTEGDRI